MKKRCTTAILAMLLLVSMVTGACGQSNGVTDTEIQEGTQVESTPVSAMTEANNYDLNIIDDKYRSYYEIFLYSYCDSDGDGIGDIKGLISQLDYINDGDDSTDTDLGMTGIWLMPIMPSTSYHKYDVTDYEAINEEYGTMEDFEALVEACHERGINLIIDLVMNHTSSQHPWFTQAYDYLKGLNGAQPSVEECPYFGYYNFTQDAPDGTYCKVGDTGWYYEAPFWSEMPDLNLESDAVRQEFDDITSFWLDKGIDGFRLDAVGEYYSNNITRSVSVLSWFTNMVYTKDPEAYIVGEAWTNLDAYAQYYASGIDSCFDFAFANTDGIIASTIKRTGGYTAKSFGNSLVNLDHTLSEYSDTYIDAPFYTNHDMGRSAGYYSGDNSEAQTKIAGAMNLMMTGNAFVYYGEELGMKGSGKDENKRAPMQWSDDASAEGMCNGPADMESIKMKYGSLADQQDDPLSIYNYYKQAVKLRNIYPQIARGSVAVNKDLSNDNICAITKTYEDETIMILFNISEIDETVDVSSVSLTKAAGEVSLGGMLLTGETAASLDGTTITMPAYSVVILK